MSLLNDLRERKEHVPSDYVGALSFISSPGFASRGDIMRTCGAVSKSDAVQLFRAMENACNGGAGPCHKDMIVSTSPPLNPLPDAILFHTPGRFPGKVCCPPGPYMIYYPADLCYTEGISGFISYIGAAVPAIPTQVDYWI